MPRPTTLPAPWDRLAEILGGVAQVAEALGTTPRTVHQWAHGTRQPRGPARRLIEQVFREAGVEPPEAT
jgi:DNA-binding transcriptional regulator YdaS (Cro superfamily)